MPSIAERAAMQTALKEKKLEAARAAKIAEEDAIMAQAGKPKTNTKKTPGKSPKATPASPPTGPPLSKEEVQKAAEAQAAADRRQALKDKTAAMLAKKKASQEELAKLNDDCTVLNETAKSLYGSADAEA